MSVLETRTGQEFRFVLPGPTVDPTQSQALLEALLPTAEPGSQPARWIIASGSLLPGMPHDFMRNWPTAQQQGVPLALDTRAPRWRQRWKWEWRSSSPACASCATCCNGR
jgi:6-phosphofructokinase 2